MQLHEYSFRMAQPVWETGTAHTMNRTVSFCTDIPLSDLPAGQQIRLAAAASCSFVLLVNGQFVAHGPARTHALVSEFGRTHSRKTAPRQRGSEVFGERAVYGTLYETFEQLVMRRDVRRHIPDER